MLNPTGANLGGKCGYVWGGTALFCAVVAYYCLPEYKYVTFSNESTRHRDEADIATGADHTESWTFCSRGGFPLESSLLPKSGLTRMSSPISTSGRSKERYGSSFRSEFGDAVWIAMSVQPVR